MSNNIIGPSTLPTILSASGVWDLRQQEIYKRDNSWPLTGATIDFLSISGSTGDASTYTFNDIPFGTSYVDREIFVSLSWIASTTRTLSSASIGEISSTVINTGSGASTGHALFFSHIPTGSSGNISITLSGIILRCAITVYRVVRSNIGQGHVNIYQGSASTASSPLNNSLAIPAKGFIIGSYGFSDNISDGIASSPYILTINDTVSSEGFWQYSTVYINTSESLASPTQTLSWTTGTTVNPVRRGHASFNS
jgi:hypothetical protein